MGRAHEGGETSLDVLEAEDAVLLDLFTTAERNRGADVEERYEYGSAAKQIIHHSAIRRAALLDVSEAAERVVDLRPVAARLRGTAVAHLEALDDLDERSQSIQGIYLNEGQDFDGPLQTFIAQSRGDIEWERSVALPKLRQVVEAGGGLALKSARYIRRHAPTVSPRHGWSGWERMPLVSRLASIISFLRDHPRAPRERRIST